MDISILDQSTRFGSPNQLKFVKGASLKELCDRHANNRFHRTTSSMQTSIESLEGILNQLEVKGLVYSYLDTSNNWKMFYVSDIDNAPTNTEESVNNSIDFKKLNRQLLVVTKYKNILKNAIDRHIDFNMSLDDIENLLNETKCYYTGVKFDNDNPMTFDRINHNKGYITGNVVACTHKVNSLKNELYEQTKSLFPDIKSLKNFVDLIYVSNIEDKDPLSVFLLEESA